MRMWLRSLDTSLCGAIKKPSCYRTWKAGEMQWWVWWKRPSCMLYILLTIYMFEHCDSYGNSQSQLHQLIRRPTHISWRLSQVSSIECALSALTFPQKAYGRAGELPGQSHTAKYNLMQTRIQVSYCSGPDRRIVFVRFEILCASSIPKLPILSKQRIK